MKVKTITVEKRNIASDYSYVGTVEETVGTMLSFEVSGNVQRIYVDAGKSVRKGELLAELNQASLKNMHEAALASLNQAKDAYTRYEQLHNQGSMPEIKWVEVESKLRQAESAESIARKNLDDSRLYAPFDGVIGSRSVDPGMNVMPGEPVLKLVDIRKVNIKISVPENEISRIRMGQPLSFIVPALGDGKFETKVTEKGVMANPLSHTYEIKAAYVNKDSRLMPGMVCNVDVWQESAASHLFVPTEIIQLDESGRRFVWVVKDGAAQKCLVSIGRLASAGIEITDGLSEGDKIITAGAQKVSEGMKVSEQ